MDLQVPLRFTESVPSVWQSELRLLVNERVLRECQQFNLVPEHITIDMYAGGQTIRGQYYPPGMVVKITCFGERGHKRYLFAAKNTLHAWCIEAVTIVTAATVKIKKHRPGRG